MSKLFLLSQIGSLIYNFVKKRKNLSINRMKSVTSQTWNGRTVYRSVNSITVFQK